MNDRSDKQTGIEDRSKLLLSEAAAEFMRTVEARGLASPSVNDYRISLWYLIAFVGADLRVEELDPQTPTQFVEWLRSTPIARHAHDTLPRTFGPAAAQHFFALPARQCGKSAAEKHCEATIQKFRMHIMPFFKFLSLGEDVHA